MTLKKKTKKQNQTNHKFKPLLFDVVFGRVWKTCLLNCVEFKVKHSHVMRIKALQILFETSALEFFDLAYII